MREKVGFMEVYKEFQLKIFHYLSRLAGHHEAEDLAREVFNKVSRDLEGFKTGKQLIFFMFLLKL